MFALFKKTSIVIVMLAFLPVNSAFAQYKCQTGKKVTYSDTPPTIGACQKLSITPHIKTKNKLLPQPLKPEITEAKENAAKVESGKSYLYDPKACNQAKSYLSLLKEGGRISKLDDKGQRIYLDDAGIKQEIDKAQIDINKTCKKS
jgi:hypothetical protein